MQEKLSITDIYLKSLNAAERQALFEKLCALDEDEFQKLWKETEKERTWKIKIHKPVFDEEIIIEKLKKDIITVNYGDGKVRKVVPIESVVEFFKDICK